ncbi:phosphoglucosamine mutase [Caldanaerobius polysaccharolyticus]|uniref:phosphoglucosamine mutase n=1 Tax=Caldanaerobius polysaccharolyticus TaxID=44256 RepID=UPI00047A6749|nr:phosphoglucosamine mutase [Caldanaerobius polysaccharolyticus]
MARMFGTDGVRGIANQDLTPELAYKLGRAGAFVLTEGARKPRIVVAKDTRISGDLLESALVAGILSVGAQALCVGIVSTPSVAILTRHYEADAGVMISASHNPVEYNGIKFFNKEGYKLSDDLEDQIEAIVKGEDELPRPVGRHIGHRVFMDDAQDVYIAYLKSIFDIRLDGLKIAVDCANGSNYKIAPRLLKDLGAEVFAINDKPDGTNINRDCGSTHIKALRDYVREVGADVGLAFDGDADRLIAVDEKGEVVDGDKVMVICALAMKEKGKLRNNAVVVTVMSNMGLDIALKSHEIDVVKTKVGDRYVLEEMLRGDYAIGGEQSGHVIFLDHNTTGDGLVTALNLLSVMVEKRQPLSSLASVMEVYPQVIVNARVSESKKHVFAEDEEISEKIKDLEEMLKGEGRVLIRPSGTEPLIRVMLEGKDLDVLKAEAKRLALFIEQRLG